MGYKRVTRWLKVCFVWVTSGLRVVFECVKRGYEWVTSGLAVGNSEKQGKISNTSVLII